ncbi:helix-turn-helix transcriptional regulator [Rhizobium sp. 0TCS1.26]|uniref:helix-turn-helix domain-containing protein n=1 Tax=Rhizobium sp. 0TCS1.26 TaxID=3142623 RepID=UPI003D26FAC9
MEAIFTRGNASDDTLGGRISLARDTVGLTLEEVARKIGVEADTLRYWENDQAEPGANRLSMLAGVLHVSLSWLLTGLATVPTGPGSSRRRHLRRSTSAIGSRHATDARVTPRHHGWSPSSRPSLSSSSTQYVHVRRAPLTFVSQEAMSGAACHRHCFISVQVAEPSGDKAVGLATA